MPQKKRFIQLPLIGKVFLGALASAYLAYLVTVVHILPISQPASSPAIVDHIVETAPDASIQHWTTTLMHNATEADLLIKPSSDLTPQNSVDLNPTKAGKQQGQLPRDNTVSYPLSTVGKIFFTSGGRDMVCSGTAVKSANRSVVDTAGHCLYWDGTWSQNLIFCPLYDHGNTPYGCWAARELAVPQDWINADYNDLHHDIGMAIVSPNDQGHLTDLVGGAGWAYNQSTNYAFYAYGYPAGYPFDGQTRKSCESSKAKTWKMGDGTVIAIPCDMTGGSSGGPWFIQIDGNWYLNGHNDFTSSALPDHMFSPYYDDTWHALYENAQNT